MLVSGVLAERSSGTVKAIATARHEIVAHGLAQEMVLAALEFEAARADIEKTTELLASVAGTRPKGWISPRGTPGRGSARHLVETGYEWRGDVFDDDPPYVQQFDQGRIVAIPFTLEINDLLACLDASASRRPRVAYRPSPP